MAFPTATNPETGERVVFINNAWQPFAQSATNPDSGGKAYLINNSWVTDTVAAPPPAEVQKGPKVLGEDDTSSDFVRALGNIPGQTQSLGGSMQALAGLATKKMGFEETGKSQIEKGLARMEEGEKRTVSKKSDEFTAALDKGIGTVLTDWLPYQVGAGVGNILESLAFAGAGAGIGAATGFGAGAVPGAAAGFVSKTLVKSGIKEAAENVLKGTVAKEIAEGATKAAAKEAGQLASKEFIENEAKKVIVSAVGKDAFAEGAQAYGKAGAKKVGSYVGTGTQAVGHGVGEVGGRAIQEGQERGESIDDIDLGRVLPAAAVHTVADFINNRIGLGALKIGDATAKSMIGEIGKRYGVTLLKEIPGEEIQAVAERYGAKLNLADADALKEYLNTAAATAAMVVAPSAVGGARTRLAQNIRDNAESEKITQDLYERQKEIKDTLESEKAALRTEVDPNLERDLRPPTLVTDTGTDTSIPPPPPAPNVSGFNAAQQKAFDYVSAIPVGGEADYFKASTKNSRAEAIEVKKMLSALDIEMPKKAQGESSRVQGVTALRQYFDNIQTPPATVNVAPPAPPTDVARPAPPTDVAPPVTTGTDETLSIPGQTNAVVIPPAIQKTFDALQKYSRTPTAQAEIAKIKTEYPDIVPTRTLSSKAQDTIYSGATFKGKTTPVETGPVTLTPESEPPVHTYDEDLSDKVNSQIANETLQEYENTQDKDRIEKLAQSKEKKNWNYDISDPDRVNYNTVSTEHNADAKAKNDERATLIAAVKETKAAHSQTINDLKTLNKNIAEAEKAKNTNLVETLKQKENDLARKDDVAEEAFSDAEDSLAEHGPNIDYLPQWDNFTASEKDIYFGQIKSGDIEEHRAAAKALLNYYPQVGSKEDAKTRLASAYEENRSIYAKAFGIKFPEWRNLTEAARTVLDNSTNNLAGLQLDVGFADLAKHLTEVRNDRTNAEKISIVKNIARVQQEIEQDRYRDERDRYKKDAKGRVRLVLQPNAFNAPTITTAVENTLDALIKESDRAANLDRLYSLTGKGEQKTKLTKILENTGQGVNNLQDALLFISTSSDVGKFNRLIAGVIHKMGLTTKIEIVKTLPDNDQAIYNPVENRIYIRDVNPIVILHEAIHAITVKVLNIYTAGDRSTLTSTQNKAVEQLIAIMNATKNISLDTDIKNRPSITFGEKYKSAYENIFEFVSYSLTSNEFQADLEDADSGQLVSAVSRVALAVEKQKPLGSVLPQKQSMWSEFKKAIADILVASFKVITNKNVSQRKEIQNQEPQSLKEALFEYKKGELNPNVEQNFLMEIAAAFEDILAVPPKGGVDLNYLSAKAPVIIKAPPDFAKGIGKNVAPPSVYQTIKNYVFTEKGHVRLQQIFQDFRAPLSLLQTRLANSNLIQRTGANINDIYGEITTAVAIAKNYFHAYIQEPVEKLNEAVAKFATASGLETTEALAELHKFLLAIHSPERRLVNFILNVPLSNALNFKDSAGNLMSVADRRTAIIKLLNTRTLTKGEAIKLRAELNGYVFDLDASGKIQLDAQGNALINKKYVDPLGKNSRNSIKPGETKADLPVNIPQKINMEDEVYDAAGLSVAYEKEYLEEYKTHKNKAEIDKVITLMQELHKQTTILNKKGNFWSQPVSNRVMFYGWDNYIPLKGKPNDDLDYNEIATRRTGGKEFQEVTGEMQGRESIGDNPILQTAYDAVRSTIRASQPNLMLAIQNNLDKGKYNPNGQGIIKGIVEQHLTFEERTQIDMGVLKGGVRMLKYNSDGSIDVLIVNDERYRDSIRKTFEQSQPLWDLANKVTGAIAQGHTRYNYNFAPLNFVRDALTNSFIIGADLGPTKAIKFLSAVSRIVATGGMYKAMQVAFVFNSGKPKDIAKLKSLTDPVTGSQFSRDMVEFIQGLDGEGGGGMVSHLSGLSMKSAFQEVYDKTNRTGILKTKDQIDKFVDTWTNMFELTSRTAAFIVAKEHYLAINNKNSKMSSETAYADAVRGAIVFAKNLANFEQVGEAGKKMGALFMFFRPSATGAVRAMQAVAPAFNFYKDMTDNLPDVIKNNPVALAEYKATYAQRQKNARIMVASLIGLGFMAHTMAKMMAPDDDQGRNAIDTDDMDRWTRFARIHIPDGLSESLGLGKNVIFQIPWGFGFGAFAAAGAQMSAMYDGTTSVRKGLTNIATSIALDSFVPLPISKIPATEMPGAFVLDSITPSVIRPVLGFVMNLNGLGQNIHNEANRRMGDAYTGGDNIPEIYKDAARGIANYSVGSDILPILDWSPNSLYFLANSYIDGLARIAETTYGISNLAEGRKEFVAKTDLPLMGSFFGSKVNIDAQQFDKAEQQIKQIAGYIKQFDSDSEQGDKYDNKYPFHRGLVEYYDSEVQGKLKDLRAEANVVRLDTSLSPRQRAMELKMITMEANVVKNDMLENFKDYGIKVK